MTWKFVEGYNPIQGTAIGAALYHRLFHSETVSCTTILGVIIPSKIMMFPSNILSDALCQMLMLLPVWKSQVELPKNSDVICWFILSLFFFFFHLFILLCFVFQINVGKLDVSSHPHPHYKEKKSLSWRIEMIEMHMFISGSIKILGCGHLSDYLFW